MKIFFVGGLFASSQRAMIVSNSIGVVQNAADSLQWGLIKGFDLFEGCAVELVNLPFVGSYPNRFKKIWFPGTHEYVLSGVKVSGLAFLNISGIKYFSRIISLLRFFLRRLSDLDNSVIIVYSAHYPFLSVVTKLKKLVPSLRVCLIIPDLPQYMSDNSGVLYRFSKNVEMRLFYRSLRRVDFFVTLTHGMQEKLNLPPDRSVVVEGIANENEVAPECFTDFNRRYIFYSGTLAERYGVKTLVDAFHSIDDDIELWICGDGDSREYVEDLSKKDPRIKYRGQLERDEVICLQQKAFLLINPRTPQGDYTKYSFPSKTIEYMLSGRPIIMYRLDGVPSEYYQYCFSPHDTTRESLANCIHSVINQDSGYLNEMGMLARKFVLSNKMPLHQVGKILNLIKGRLS